MTAGAAESGGATAVSFFRSFQQPGGSAVAGEFGRQDGTQWRRPGLRSSGGGGGVRLSGSSGGKLLSPGGSRAVLSRLMGVAVKQCLGCLRLASASADAEGTQASSPSRPALVRVAGDPAGRGLTSILQPVPRCRSRADTVSETRFGPSVAQHPVSSPLML